MEDSTQAILISDDDISRLSLNKTNSEKRMPATLRLPTEILYLIFEFLPPQGLKKVVEVCRRWRDIGESPKLWQWVHLTISPNQTKATMEILQTRRLQKIQFMTLSGISSLDPSVIAAVQKKLVSITIKSDFLNKEDTTDLFFAISQSKKLKSIKMHGVDISSLEPKILAKSVENLEDICLDEAKLTTKQTQAMLIHVCLGTLLKSLDISNNNLSSVRTDILVGALNKLETVNISCTHLRPEQAQSIFDSISEKTSVKRLNMGYMNLSEVNHTTLATAINRLEAVNIQTTLITPEQATAVFTYINTGTNLNSLNIRSNDLTEVDPILLASALNKVNTVNVEYTALTSQQIVAVLNAITVETKLTNLFIKRDNDAIISVDSKLQASAANMLDSSDIINPVFTYY